MERKEMLAKSWRADYPHKPLFGQKVEPFPATRLFDQLSFIGTPNVGCFVLETSAGYVLLDCMEPIEEHKQQIIQGFETLNMDLNHLVAIVITHGHGDHYGCADYFREKYGCKVYMSKTDYEYARTDTMGPMGTLKWEIWDFLEDGDVLEFGETTIHAYATPGHTPGGLSYIFNVTDEGRPHMVAMWGGTGIPRTVGDKVKYLKSTLYFADKTAEYECDAEISTHPFVDQGIARMRVMQNIPNGVPNPFVLGKENYKYYESMFTDMCLRALEEQAKIVDPLLPPPAPRPRCK